MNTETNIVRTLDDGAWGLKSMKGWGFYYTPCNDPQPTTELNRKQLEQTFIFSQDFVKLPQNIYDVIVSFFLLISERMNCSEVGVLLLRDLKTKQQYKVIVPEQRVTKASVVTDNSKYIDLLTGKEGTVFPPPGWAVCGTAHSHGNFSAFYSQTDQNDELGMPGLHFVVGKLAANSHESVFSIVTTNGRRIILEKDDLVGEIDPAVEMSNVSVNNAKAMSYVQFATSYIDTLSNPTSISNKLYIIQPEIPSLFKGGEELKAKAYDPKKVERLINKISDEISDFLEENVYDKSFKETLENELQIILGELFSKKSEEDEEYDDFDDDEEYDDLEDAASLVVDPFYYKE